MFVDRSTLIAVSYTHLDVYKRQAWEYIKKIDEIGGAPEAIAKGYIQKEIQDSAYKLQMEIEKGDRIIVGVNLSLIHIFRKR